MQNQSTDESVPKDYEPPTVTVLGDLAELTQGGLGNTSDGQGPGSPTP